MAKRRSESKADGPEKNWLHTAAAFTFNIGLAVFIAAGAWYLCAGPASSSTAFWSQLILAAGGLAIAGPAWVVGSPLSPSSKWLTAILIFAGVFGVAWMSAREFEAETSVLEPWRIDGDRLVHDGLGLSLAIPPGWEVDWDPQIVKGSGTPASQSSRLWYGQKAVFLHLRHRKTPDKPESTLILQGGSGTFSSFQQSLIQVLEGEQSFAAEPGARIRAHTRLSELNGMPVLMFEADDARGVTCSEIYFRSGSYLLNLVVMVADTADQGPLNECVNSVRVTGRANELTD